MPTFIARARLALLSLAIAAACGGDDGAAGGDGGPPGPDGDLCPSPAEILPDGWRPVAAVSAGALTDLGGTIRVDASAGGFGNAANEPFVYLDLDGAAPAKLEVDDVGSFDSADWDVALKRYVIRANGGDSGTGGVKVAAVNAADLAAVTAVPAAAQFQVDDWGNGCAFVADDIGGPLTTFSPWFAVDAGVLAPIDLVFVVETTAGAHVALEILDYYADPADAARSGVYEIAWKPL